RLKHGTITETTDGGDSGACSLTTWSQFGLVTARFSPRAVVERPGAAHPRRPLRRNPPRASAPSTPRSSSPPAAPATVTDPTSNAHARSPVTSPHRLHMRDPEWFSLGDR